MKLYSIILMRWLEFGKEPVILSSVHELSSFGYFTRGSARELLIFVGREVAARTRKGERQSVLHKGHMCHCYVHPNGMACAVICDEEYPQRVGFNLCGLALDALVRDHTEASLGSYSTDQELQVGGLDGLLTKYQV